MLARARPTPPLLARCAADEARLTKLRTLCLGPFSLRIDYKAVK
jgi:hypothetical protein